MAVNVDTIYQRVLAMANKEQRGYITPQEFNLFANQAQMEIFEQYFYDINQFNRIPGNQTEFADMLPLLEEKISVFKKRHQPVSIVNQFGDGNLPSDVYRLGTVIRYGLTGVEDTTAAEIEVVTEEDLIYLNSSPLTNPKKIRPLFVRKSNSSIKIYPYSGTLTGDQSNSAVLYFQQTGQSNYNTNLKQVNLVGTTRTTGGASYATTAVTLSSANTAITVGQTVTGTNVAPLTTVAAISTTALTLSTTPSAAITAGTTLTFNENNVNFIESGQTVINAGWSGNTTVSSISANILTVADNVSTGGDRVIIFASDDIKCNYIAKPTIVNWGYTEINGSALYNSASSTDFQLHDSEESKLTYKILSLAGINLGGDLYTIGSQEENKKIQQEKQ